MKKKLSKVDQVYEYLLREIIAQKYHAGDRLIISQIAKTCAVSETPVREALRRLEKDGYVRINTNQGALALRFDTNSIINICQIRGLLEGYATRLSIEYLSPNDISQLHIINNQLKEASLSQNYSLYSQLNVDFHMYIYRRMHNQDLLNLISDLWEKWNITTKVFSLVPERMEDSYHEHEHILALIEQRDADNVEKYTRMHKFHTSEYFSRQYSS